MFDGDQESLICVHTEESLNEMNEYFRSKRAYIGVDGRLRYSMDYDSIKFVAKNLCVFEEEPK